MISASQAGMCERMSADMLETLPDELVGVSRSALAGEIPLNGLRHPKGVGTSGWFLWGGSTLDSRDDFFAPMHVRHLEVALPAVSEYLALGPGWRFLIAPGHEDVWFDQSLLAPEQ